MRKIIKNYLLLPIFTLVFSLAVSAQNYNTGNTEFDASLRIINTNAGANLTAFKLEMSKTYAVPLTQIESMFSISMSAGDVYLMLEIGRLVKRPVPELIVIYKKHKGKGWGVIAKEMGIKPGSAEFHALKGKAKNKSSKPKGNSNKPQSKGNGNGKGKGKGQGNGKKK